MTLLERTRRSVTLTEAGSVLLREGRAALDAVDAADRRTRRAAPAAGPPKLVLVTTVIAWPPHSHSRAVATLVRTATRL